MRFLLVLAIGLPLFGTYAADNSLQGVLARMDSAAAKYKSMKADVRRLAHTEVLGEDTVETGTIAVKRPNAKDLRMRISIQPPNEKQVLVTPNRAEVYYPKINTVQEFEVGKSASVKEQILLLSFGSTSKELLSSYNAQAGPSETIAGHKTTRLDLIPKDKQSLAQHPKIQLWISDETGVAVQQKMNEPGGDFQQATYSNIQLTNVSDADVRLDIPKNAKHEKVH